MKCVLDCPGICTKMTLDSLKNDLESPVIAWNLKSNK